MEDGASDSDQDTITNLVEQSNQTNPRNKDTDQDRLNDSEELNIHLTSPVLEDTDKDGVSDGREVELGLNPLLSDSDQDGSGDATSIVVDDVELKEEIKQQFIAMGVVPSVRIEGNPNAAILTDIRKAEYVVGLDTIPNVIGAPINIHSIEDIESATISFRIIDTQLASNLDDYRIIHYDEENQQLSLLPDQIIDHENQTIAAQTDHFSIYLLMNYKKWLDLVLNQNFNPGKPTSIRGKIDDIVLNTSFSYKNGSVVNYGESKIEALDQSILENRISEELVKNQQFEYINENKDFLSLGMDQLVDSSLSGNWKALIVVSETKYLTSAVSMESLIKIANSNNIKVFTYLTSDGVGTGEVDLSRLAEETGGASIRNDLQEVPYSVQMIKEIRSAILKEEDMDEDGIMDGQDHDKDGLVDGVELGYLDEEGHAFEKPSLIQLTLSLENLLQNASATNDRMMLATQPNYSYSTYAIKQKSCYNNSDCDRDGYSDKIDLKPVKTFIPTTIFLHGLNSDVLGVYGVENDVATADGPKNNSTDAPDDEYFSNIENQKIHGDWKNDWDKDRLAYKIAYFLDLKNASVENKVLAFNYANKAYVTSRGKYPGNDRDFRVYLQNLVDKDLIEKPTKNSKPVVNVVVHSMEDLMIKIM